MDAASSVGCLHSYQRAELFLERDRQMHCRAEVINDSICAPSADLQERSRGMRAIARVWRYSITLLHLCYCVTLCGVLTLPLAVVVAQTVPDRYIEKKRFSDETVSRPLGADLVCSFGSPGSSVLTLSEAINRALCSSADYKKAWSRVLEQAAELGIDRAALLPTLSMTLSDDRYHRTTDSKITFFDADMHFRLPHWDVGVDVPIYDFGQRRSKIAQTRELFNGAAADARNTLLDVATGVADVYFKTVTDAAAVLNHQQTLDLASETDDVATARYRGGTAAITDMLRAHSELLRARSNLSLAQREFRTAVGALSLAIGLQPDVGLQTPPDVDDAGAAAGAACTTMLPINELLALASKENPKVRAAQAELYAAEHGLDLAAAQRLPTISARLRSDSNDQQFIGVDNKFGINQVPTDNLYKSANIGIGISIPLFGRSQNVNNVRVAEARIVTQEAGVEVAQREVAKDVWTNYQKAQSSCCLEAEDMRGLLETASKTLVAVQATYSSGTGDISDVIDAQRTLSGARLQDLQRRADCRMATLHVSASLGRLGF